MAERVIGVTGGIGSGKSSVMRAFQAKGIEAVDADDMARVVVEPGQPALNAIAEHFGPDILTPEGTLNRPALRTIIFSDPDAKTWLEALLHPLINQELRLRLAAAQGPYALLVSPLLFETGQDRLVDRILVVDVPESVQLARASARDGADPEQIRRIMASQMSREERLRRADDVLDNSGHLADLERQVGELHGKYSV
ncbi:dephospho-CoA kinase [Marinimicrobium koreense]|uniref:dephospho-CoA kinase n=1 Tax=Marinimicrobium koreense TaxID=306545 RepID=UPI003F6F5293